MIRLHTCGLIHVVQINTSFNFKLTYWNQKAIIVITKAKEGKNMMESTTMVVIPIIITMATTTTLIIVIVAKKCA